VLLYKTNVFYSKIMFYLHPGCAEVMCKVNIPFNTHNYSRAWLSLRLKERYCTFTELSSFAWQNHYYFNFEDPAIYSLANIPKRLQDLDQLIERAFK